VLGYSIIDMMFNGTDEELKQAKVTLACGILALSDNSTLYG